MKCSCGAVLANDAHYCHQCGREVAANITESDWPVTQRQKANATQRRPWKHIGIVLTSIALLIFLFWVVYIHQTATATYLGAFKVVLGCVFEIPWVLIQVLIAWQIMRKPKGSVNEKIVARKNILGTILLILAIFVSIHMVDHVLPRLDYQRLAVNLSANTSQATLDGTSSTSAKTFRDNTSDADRVASLSNNSQFQTLLASIATGKTRVTPKVCRMFWGFFPNNLISTHGNRVNYINGLKEGTSDQIAFWESMRDSAKLHKVEMTKEFMVSKVRSGQFSEELRSALSAAAANRPFTINNKQILINEQSAQHTVDLLKSEPERLQPLVIPGCL